MPIARTYNKSGDVIASYNNFEPRFSFKIQATDKASIKGSYNRMVQYLHLISNTTASNPLDVWNPSTKNIVNNSGCVHVSPLAYGSVVIPH